MTSSPALFSSVIRVGGRSDVGRVAGCIAHTLRSHNQAHLRAIGPNAVYVAMKAVILAGTFLAEEGGVLAVVPAMVEGGDRWGCAHGGGVGGEVGVIVFTVLQV